jgi:predicted O-methyltransferase YrrM
MLLARTIGARSILEVGTLAGYNTIWLARALEEGGKLITLEANADYAKIALGNITTPVSPIG